jgi:hypothetical protein
MISLLKQLEWNYIVVLYDMDTYGTEGYYALKVRSKEENICITSAFAVPIGKLHSKCFSNYIMNYNRNKMID